MAEAFDIISITFRGSISFISGSFDKLLNILICVCVITKKIGTLQELHSSL